MILFLMFVIFGYKIWNQIINSDEKINITTFANKMNLNMTQVSGTFFKKNDD